MTLYVLGTAFTLWMAVECVRRGNTSPWLWIILIFPTVGAAVYFFAEVLSPRTFFSRGPRAASSREVNHLRAEVRRLDNSEAWTDYAHALRSRKRFPEALEAAEKACARDPENLRALYERGLAQSACEKFREAAVSLARVVERAPGHDSGEARFTLALAQEGNGDKVEARRTLESLARTTSLPKVLFRLASLQAEAGDTQKARETLERIVEESEYVPAYHRREMRPWVR
ncbi:MAG: tetratricopeptide repeat protein, partial [Vicinamibacteria bacterium]